MKRWMTILALAGALLIGGSGLPAFQPIAGAALAAERTVVLTLETLLGGSSSCAVTVYRALFAVDGVAAADISTRTGTAIVIYDDSRAEIGDILAATAEAGFPAEAAE